MALTDYTITSAELADKGVTYLPDTPMLTRSEMQHKLDELALDVLVPKHNGLVGAIVSDYASKTYVDDTVVATGAGDMAKSVYDTDNDGTVNNSDKLGGALPAAYMTKAVYDADGDGVADNAQRVGGYAVSVVDALPETLASDTLYFVY